MSTTQTTQGKIEQLKIAEVKAQIIRLRVMLALLAQSEGSITL